MKKLPPIALDDMMELMGKTNERRDARIPFQISSPIPFHHLVQLDGRKCGSKGLRNCQSTGFIFPI